MRKRSERQPTPAQRKILAGLSTADWDKLEAATTKVGPRSALGLITDQKAQPVDLAARQIVNPTKRRPKK